MFQLKATGIKHIEIDYFCTMTAHPICFKVLFCFEDEFKLIVEIKRTDIQSEEKSLLYKWLNIDKSSSQISQLTFQSMNQLEGKQLRNFAEGNLTWDTSLADYNSEEITRVDSTLDAKWLKLINDFLI